MLVPKSWTESSWRAVDPQGTQWFRSPLDATYHLVYRFSDGADASQSLSMFNLRRWLQSDPKGRLIRVQYWGNRLEIAALDGTKIKFHSVQHATEPEDVAYHILLCFDQLDWSGTSVPLFWEGVDATAVRHWTRHFITHWHERSLDGILHPH